MNINKRGPLVLRAAPILPFILAAGTQGVSVSTKNLACRRRANPSGGLLARASAVFADETGYQPRITERAAITVAINQLKPWSP